MFVVYSADGRNMIGMSQAIPQLKVDPATQINAVPKTELEEFKLDQGDAAKKQHAFNAGIRQYESTLGEGKHTKHLIVKVGDIMSAPVVTIDKSASIAEAWQLMTREKVHHLPVMDDGKLVGLCSSHCVLSRGIFSVKGELEKINNEPVEQVMSNHVITTHQQVDIRKVAYAMTYYDQSCLPIMSESHEVVGMVTFSDLVKRLAEEPPIELYV